MSSHFKSIDISTLQGHHIPVDDKKPKQKLNNNTVGNVNDGEFGALLELQIGKTNCKEDITSKHTLLLHIGISIQNMPKETESLSLTRCECQFIHTD